MEVGGQNLVVTERVRRRVSKWDVEAEHHEKTEIFNDNTLPAKVDTSVNLTELDSAKFGPSLNIDSFEIDQSADQSGKVSDDNIICSDVIIEMPHNPKQIHPEGDCRSGFKKQDWEHALQEKTMAEWVVDQSGKVLDNNITPSDILNKMPQHTKQIDLEVDCNNSFKEQDFQHDSKEQILPEQVEDEDKELDEMPPGYDEGHQWNSSISPTDVKSRPDRLRSRSKSRSRSSRSKSKSRSRSRSPPRSWSRSWSRSKSPSHVHKPGSERWKDTDRTRGAVSPCRDFAAGRCRLGNGCRFLHEGGGSKQFDRNYYSGSADGRGSRTEKTSYPRENFSRRNDSPFEDRGFKSSTICFDFTRGKCLRGASCRYIHDGQPSDGGWNARVDSRARLPDRRGGGGAGASFGQRPEHQRTSSIPCRFFLENCCRRGESCSFSHQVKPPNIPTDSSVNTQLHDRSTNFSPPLPLNGQMQQIAAPHPQNLQNQLQDLHQPPNSHFFNANMQNQPSNPLSYESNPQNLGFNGQAQQNLLNGNIQPDFNGQIQQNLLMHSQNESNYNINGKFQQNVPPIHNAQNLLVAHLPLPILQQHIKPQVTDSSETKPSQINPEDPIINKVVTIEQAAKIVDLSASLAQFFGTAALNSQPAAGMAPQPFLNSGHLGPLQTTFQAKPLIQQMDSSSMREVKKTEAAELHKELLPQLPNGDEEGRKNGESNKMKEAKDIRMFRCALIEFVKDMLKPKWKEGQLSKEAHKTIVKKVVDKVSGSLQGLNVPQTQEKIDLYLLSSKPKLSKLVQAYVEKYVKE